MTVPVSVGDVLAGKYRVERVIGAGGMGVVISARHLHLGERVAIKFLLPAALAMDEVVQRFLREGQASVRIRSEHVAKVFDVGTLDSGAPYLVMEYLDGFDLGRVLEQSGPLPVDIAIDYVLQACEALAEAHALGMVHRDLKPANLFLTSRADGSPVVKVIDFGISKVGGLGGEGDGGMTKSAVMMGSPLFMAPEQMASARDADARSDIWSIGVILHTLIGGAPPFAGETAIGVFEQMMKGPPPLRSIRPGVPEGLERVVLACLRRDPAERPATVADLAVALGPYAPPASQISIDRIVRVLRPKGAPAAQASTPPPQYHAALAVAPTVHPDAHASPSMQGQGSYGAVAAGTTGGDPRSLAGPTAMEASLVASQPPARRSSPAVALGVLGLVAAVAIGATVLTLGREGGEGVVPATQEVVVPAPPKVEPPVAAPKVEVDAAPVDAGAPDASASSKPAAQAPPPRAPTPPAQAPPPRAPPPTAPAPPPPRPPTSDPFADPR